MREFPKADTTQPRSKCHKAELKFVKAKALSDKNWRCRMCKEKCEVVSVRMWEKIPKIEYS